MVRKGVSILFGTVVLVGLLAAPSGCGQAEAKFPNKPITMVVTVTPGGPVDIYARQVARLAEKVLGVTFSVENRPGGSGIVALSYVKSQPADGYTVVATTSNLMYVISKPGEPVAPSDFDWLIQQNGEPPVIGVKADGQFKTLADMISFAKANPGKVKIGGAQTGGFQHAMVEKLSRTAGVRLTYIGFEGGDQAVIATLGGHIDAFHASPSTGRAQVQEGKIKLLAVGHEKRLDFMSDVPTYRESGVDLTAWQWRGLTIKKGVSPENQKILHDAFKKITDTPEWKDYIKQNLLTETYMGTTDFNKLVAKEEVEAREMLKDLVPAK